MIDLVSLTAGLAVGVLLIATARGLNFESWMYATSLATLPLVYVLFGFLAGSSEVMGMELKFGIPFFTVCMMQLLLRNPWVTALTGIMWLAHGGYDLAHDAFFVNPGVWFWYPVFCAAVDIIVGGYLLYLAYIQNPKTVLK